MGKKLVLAWRNPSIRQWIPVGLLQYKGNRYIFEYTKGAKSTEEFVPFGIMQELHDCYESEELFPIFRNRLLPKSRPEYSSYMNWLGFGSEGVSELEELARSGGIRATDSLQLFPVPEKVNGKYEILFFSHGIRHLPPNYIERVNHLNQGSNLYLMRDIQNKCDSLALALRTDDPIEIVGYCPKFFVQDLDRLINENDAENVNVSIVKININSPLQFRLLCKFSTSWPENFIPFKDENFLPLTECTCDE